MQWFMKIQEYILRVTFHPLQMNKKIHFTEALNQIKTVLVLCQEEQITPDYSNRLKKVLKNAEFIFLLQSETVPAENKMKSRIVVIPRGFLLKMTRTAAVDELQHQAVDLLIDLDYAPNIFAYYLCRRLRPKICLAYDKPGATFYNNILIRTQTSQPGPERIECVCRTLSRLMQKGKTARGRRIQS